MNKKVITIISIVAVLIIAGVIAFFIINNRENHNNNNQTNNNGNNSGEVTDNNPADDTPDENSGTPDTVEGKTLVVYYSAQNHTKAVSEKIAANLGADLFELVPEVPYTSSDLNYSSSTSRVSREHNDVSLRDIKLVSTTVENWEDYDTVLIGYPIWWGIAAWPVDNFIKANDFAGKTVIPFCTSSSSGLGQSGNLLRDMANGGNWQEGHRFSSNPSDDSIKSFTDTINK